MIAIAYTSGHYAQQAESLAEHLHLPIDNTSQQQLRISEQGLQLCISPFLPMQANFERSFWQKRYEASRKQGLLKACKPHAEMHIIDATAGWGRDAAILACSGAKLTLLERNPIIAALLQDAINRQQDRPDKLQISLHQVDAIAYLRDLTVYPHLIYLDPMHPQRQKSALVKKDLQVLQQLLEPDADAQTLLQIACQRVLQQVVVKWPQKHPPLLPTRNSIIGKTVRFDLFAAKN